MNWMAAIFSKERTVAPDHFNRWLAPLASIAHSPVHWRRIRLEPLQCPANSRPRRCCERRRRLEPLASRLDLHRRDRMPGAGSGLWRAVAGAGGAALGWRGVGGVLGRRLSGGGGWHPHAAVVAALSWLWRARWLRLRSWLCVAGEHTAALVSRPSGDGHGHGDHGLWRWRDHSGAAQGVPDPRVLPCARNIWATSPMWNW